MREEEITALVFEGPTKIIICENMVIELDNKNRIARVFDSGDEFQDYCNGGVTREDIIKEMEEVGL